jgi:fluoride exporter
VLLIWYVALGSAIGGVARYLLGGLIQRDTAAFPWGTLVINISGSFILGLIMRYALAGPIRAETRAFLTIGLCGGFTTFSTFSYETVSLLRDGQWLRAGTYVGASIILSLVAVLAGFAVAREAWQT